MFKVRERCRWSLCRLEVPGGGKTEKGKPGSGESEREKIF